MKVIILMLFMSFNLIKADNFHFLVKNDSLVLQLDENRIKLIELELDIINDGNNNLYINKDIGVIAQTPPLSNDKIEFFCHEYNQNGRFEVLIYDKFCQIVRASSFLSVGDLVYFTKEGKLKYELLEGVESQRNIKRSLGRFVKLRSKPMIFEIPAHGKESIQLSVFLGNYYFKVNHIYYLQLRYNNHSRDNGLTHIQCAESNIIKLIMI